MNEIVRKASRDRRSGAAEVAAAAAKGIALLESRRDVMRAARLLLRAHPVMAPLWHLLADALEDPAAAARSFLAQSPTEAAGAAHSASWVFGRRAIVLTHSASSSVLASVRNGRRRISRVLCTESNPGGEGKAFVRRLSRDGFDAEMVFDTAMAAAAARAHVVLVGADAVTERGVVNKIGTHLLALAAREAGTPFYVVAGTSKLLPDTVWRRATAPLYDQTPLALVDGIVTERGVLSPGAARRALAKVVIPQSLIKVL